MLLLVLTRRKARKKGEDARGTGSATSPSFGTTLDCGWLADGIYRGPLPTAAGGEARGAGSAASPSFGVSRVGREQESHVIFSRFKFRLLSF
jgi:hypothetical protein